MEVTHRSPACLVIDDVLGEAAARFQRMLLAQAPYELVNHAGRWNPAWRLGDAQPLQGPTYRYGADDEAHAEWLSPLLEAMDALVVRQDVTALVGKRGTDWEFCGASPWLYPPRSALSVHVDGHRFSGAFVYFAHERWKIRWGGLLLVFDADTRGLAMNLLDDEQDDQVASVPGIATAILPRPNRLVFLSPVAAHSVTEVTAKAGDNLRVTVAGFFNRPSVA